jgi:hypothetical protein
MKSRTKLAVGMHVRVVAQHWLRGGEIAEILRFEQRGQNNWLVKFDPPYAGGGIDGDKLWLSQHEFAEVLDEDAIDGAASEAKHNRLTATHLNGSSHHEVESQDRQNGAA